MNASSELIEATPRTQPAARNVLPAEQPLSHRSKLPLHTLLAVPVATVLAFVVHLIVSQNDMELERWYYSTFLGGIFVASVVALLVQPLWPRLRTWVVEMSPILAATIILLAGWETITSGLRWLPMPYFPSPAAVLLNLIDDRAIVADSTWHSLQLLLGGYAIGVLVGVTTGVCIGWFAPARYWGMPILKVVGPIPATAWIPLAMIIAPNATVSALGLIALAVWFPVTMLTASGISNTRASYLDVARTLGAGRTYLIFRVAIPAAMPNIFIGLFMGLGASFLTLVVAETVGVKSGLGWYLQWAQGWAEYGKVYAALIVMAVFFSTIMTLLFKIRDRVLVWQKGTIKW
ncbi:ABC transporter permease [Verrucomicrobiota bacterium sgz303538]